MCSPVAFILPAYLIIAMAGFKAISGIWLPALASGASFALVQALVSAYMGPQLSAIFAALASMAVLIAVIRFRDRKQTAGELSAEAEFAGTPGLDIRSVGTKELVAPAPITAKATTNTLSEVLYAWVPYALLVTCVMLWGFAPIQKLLNKASSSVAWPFLNNLVLRMPPVTAAPAPYHAVFALNVLSAAGTACMVATFLTAIALRVSLPRFARILAGVCRQLALPIATVSLVLGVGFLMNYCGATATLGLAFASTGKSFPFFSPMLGLLGVFLTGSDTSSNALFGNLQVVTATRLGLDPVLMAAANAAGGVMGKMISLQTIAVAAAATGLAVSEQARLFRFTLKHSIFLAFLVGCLAVFYSYGLHI